MEVGQDFPGLAAVMRLLQSQRERAVAVSRGYQSWKPPVNKGLCGELGNSLFSTLAPEAPSHQPTSRDSLCTNFEH